MMAKPKKWFLVRMEDGITLNYSDGPIHKPKATTPLGTILEVSKPVNVHSEDAIMVSCL